MRIALVLLFAALSLHAQTPDDARAAKVDALFAEWNRADSPGFSVAVIRDGKTVLARGYGMADLERDTRITPRSVFDVGSMSKQFTAAAILLLEQEGKLSVDDDVRKYVPELRAYERPITIRHLIHHTSGLRDYLTLMGLGGVSFINDFSDEETLSWITRQKALNFLPGDQHLYSNSGYYLLGRIVERASGMSLREYAAKKIFEPLGMTNTHYHDDPMELVKHRAIGYSPREKGEGYRIEMSFNHVVGDGGVYTTTEDLAKWDANFYEPKAGGAALLEAMLRRGKLANGEELDYAAGLHHATHNGRRVVEHGGGWAGYRSNMMRFPEERLSVIALSNLATADPAALSRAVAGIYLDAAPAPATAAPPPPPATATLSAAQLQKLAGLYVEKTYGFYRTLEVRDGKLWSVRGTRPTELRPLADGTFSLAGTKAIVTLDGNTIEVRSPDSPSSSWRRVEAFTPTSLAEFAGEYRSDEIVAPHRIRVDGKQLSVRAGYDPSEVKLMPRERDVFEGDNIVLRFKRDAKGAVSGYTVAAGRVSGIAFERVR